MENPDAVMIKGVCVERTSQKASHGQSLRKPQAHGTGRGRTTEQLGKDGLEEQEGNLRVEAGPPTKEHFENKGVVSRGELNRHPAPHWFLVSLSRADSRES